ncbi:MAG: hypothetical protein B7Y36_18660 [Novosphingobium sp. 28-62-57]|uniref:hypothetical protein n=1 Tax=unclassified Novosphingobium TaxID=2644732 RepID=UPI000BC7631D|nr:MULTISPECIES: hypothetical protein [unclassified Novosphingobium]OYW50762.1 MAG: hypothetical protein B7Z34_02760 [Novosphingobium sp. 12-62-10]OYZ07891.1 MAG: hypothetical protein B7Y36_18660 [Novosphingobium sp. 28-62-57]
MTAPARISQADMERATKSVKAAGFERARIVMDLSRSTIEIIIGESANVDQADATNEWTDDDV